MKKIQTNYTAPIGKSYALELFIERVMNEIKEQKGPKTVGDNLTNEERLALNDMKMKHWQKLGEEKGLELKDIFSDNESDYSEDEDVIEVGSTIPGFSQ